MSGIPMTYAGSGVNYDLMDPFKKLAQQAGFTTSHSLARHGLREETWTRGESVHLVHDPLRDCYWGHVHEGLGTKNKVADDMGTLGSAYYSAIAQDTLAMGLNDAATLGVRPTTVTMHLAVGSSEWFKDEVRCAALIEGWRATCVAAGATWAGGETPTLRDIIYPGAAELSCSVVGLIEKPENVIRGDIQHGDRIVIIESSGIGANGLTLARDVNETLEKKYETEIPGGQTYGQALLTPTLLYGPTVEACQDAGVKIRYGVNITGHASRKLMRLNVDARYVIERLPTPAPIFQFLQEQGNVSSEEMYGNLNMGCGFALYVPEKDVQTVIQVAEERHQKAFDAGYIEFGAPKEVVLEPVGITFKADSLQVR